MMDALRRSIRPIQGPSRTQPIRFPVALVPLVPLVPNAPIPKLYEHKYGRLLITPTDKLIGNIMDQVVAATHLKLSHPSKGV